MLRLVLFFVLVYSAVLLGVDYFFCLWQIAFRSMVEIYNEQVQDIGFCMRWRAE